MAASITSCRRHNASTAVAARADGQGHRRNPPRSVASARLCRSAAMSRRDTRSTPKEKDRRAGRDRHEPLPLGPALHQRYVVRRLGSAGEASLPCPARPSSGRHRRSASGSLITPSSRHRLLQMSQYRLSGQVMPFAFEDMAVEDVVLAGPSAGGVLQPSMVPGVCVGVNQFDLCAMPSWVSPRYGSDAVRCLALGKPQPMCMR